MGTATMARRTSRAVLAAAVTLALAAATTHTQAAGPHVPPDGFSAFLREIYRDARERGVSEGTWQRARPYLAWHPDVLPKPSAQPEHTRSIGSYVEALASQARIAAGRDALRTHAQTLAEVEARTGVDRYVVLAIWGIETNYGRTTGRHNILSALATLAYAAPRRNAFWRRELLAALDIADAGDIEPAAMTGSWAGAMGHTQFMPTTYARYAADFDGDGRRDIWGNTADALASTASYLRRSGWRPGAPWALEVVLPPDFDFDHADPSQTLPAEAWQVLGLTRPRGAHWPVTGDLWRLLLPAGAAGPAFLAGPNYRAILRYNASMAYAIAVGLLADALRGAAPLVAPWPAAAGLAHEERRELQARLTALGLDTGGIDAVLGNRTRQAIRAFQRTKGLPADGHPSRNLLQMLRRE